MDQGPLVTDDIDAGAELAREFDKCRPVKAVFWLKAADDEHRYLYLASDQIDDIRFEAYGEMARLTDEMQPPRLDPFRVKLISGDNPLALAAVEILNRFPGPEATRFGGTLFGGQFVDDVYIYPSPLPAAVP